MKITEKSIKEILLHHFKEFLGYLYLLDLNEAEIKFQSNFENGIIILSLRIKNEETPISSNFFLSDVKFNDLRIFSGYYYNPVKDSIKNVLKNSNYTMKYISSEFVRYTDNFSLDIGIFKK